MPEFEGLDILEEELYGCNVATAQVRSEQEAEKLRKAVGDYITITAGANLDRLDQIEDIGECLAEVLGRVMRPHYQGKLCIVGIGNKDLPADALGPATVNNLPLKALSVFGTDGNFSEVCSLVPGTAATNNIDTEVIVGGVVKAIGADCVMLVDSLTTVEPSRLFQAIQISTAGGLSPLLSGRKADWAALDVPVISLGVPVAISSAALMPHQDSVSGLFTSIGIQTVIASAARIIAYAILRMCWPSKSRVECFILSGLNCDPVASSFLRDGDSQKAEPDTCEI